MADQFDPQNDNLDSLATGADSTAPLLSEQHVSNRNAKLQRARLNAEAAAPIAPETAGKALAMSRSTGIPPMLAAENTSVHDQSLMDLALSRVAQDSPALLNLLASDPVMYANSKDEIEQLQAIEQQIKQRVRDVNEGETFAATAARIGLNLRTVGQSALLSRSPDEATAAKYAEGLAQTIAAYDALPRDTRIDPYVTKSRRAFARGDTMGGWMALLEIATDPSAAQGAANTLLESAVTAIGGTAIDLLANLGDVTGGEPSAVVGAGAAAKGVSGLRRGFKVLSDAGRKRAAEGAAVATSAGVMTYEGGYPAYLMEGWNKPENTSLPALERARVAQQYANTKAAAEGLVNAAVSPLGILAPGGIIGRAAGLGTSSAVAGGAGAAAASASVGEPIDWTDVGLETILEVPGAAVDVGAATWGERKAQAYNDRLKAAIERAGRMEQTLRALSSSASNLASRERSPGTLAQFVDMAIEQHGTVPAELGIGARHLLAAVGEEGVADLRSKSERFDQQIDEAMQNDGEIVLDTSELVEWSAGLTPEQQKIIAENVREHDGALTVAEAEEAKAELERFNQEAAADVADEDAADGDYIFEKFHADLVAADQERAATPGAARIDPQANARYAELMKHAMVTIAKRAGMKPRVLFDRFYGGASATEGDGTAVVNAAAHSPADILRDLAAASGNEAWVAAVQDGTFVGLDTLNVDSSGNVVVTRQADSELGLLKSNQTMTREELKSVAEGGGSFGHAGVNTSAMSQWGKRDWAAAGEGATVGEFSIPPADLLNLIRSGDAAVANVSLGEIVFRPGVLDKYLTRLNGKAVGPAQEAYTTNEGRKFEDFFEDITTGTAGAPKTSAASVKVLNRDRNNEVVDEFMKHSGNFDRHIEASIPGFRDVQFVIAEAIVETFENADMLDIGASEGALVKTVAARGNNIRTVALDPNEKMAATFANKSTVPGTEYSMTALGTAEQEGTLAWTTKSGAEINYFKPDRKFDIVHEAMVFQFISNDRESQIARVAELLKDDGVAIFEQKFVAGEGLSQAEWKANEAMKDAFKERFFDKEEMKTKAETVLVGMNKNMVSPGEFERVLRGKFQYVARFWKSGNFAGYIATNDAAKFDQMLSNIGDTSSPFSEQLVEDTRVDQTPGGLPLWSLERAKGARITDAVKKSAIALSPKATLARKNYDKLDAIFKKVPNPLESEESWRKFMSLLVADRDVLGVPYVALKYAQDAKAVAEYLSNLRPDQLASRRAGFALGEKIRKEYIEGRASPLTTGRLLLWAMLSRKAGAYPHEAAYMDLINGGVDRWIEKAASGEWSAEDSEAYAKWSSEFMATKKGGVSPSAGVTSNANDFGKILLTRMSERGADGQTSLARLHSIIADDSVSTNDVRREFFALGDSLGIQNKVLSFALLVTGRWDTLVLDRVQFTHLWGEQYRQRSGQRNIYDNGLAAAGEGHFGLAVYEALARGMTEPVRKGYELAGLSGVGDGTLGAFHWDSWLIESSQAIGHPTIEALDTELPRPDLAVRQGKFDTYGYNFEYRADGMYQIPMLDGTGYILLTPSEASEFQSRISDAKEGVVPKDFKVSQNKSKPWVDAEGVNRERYDEILKGYGNRVDAKDVPPSGLADAARPLQQRASDERFHQEAPSLAPLPGAPLVEGATGPIPELVAIAEQYARDNGIPYHRQAAYVDVDEARAKRIADAFAAMKHDPKRPDVELAYDDMINQTLRQYDALIAGGYSFTFFDAENDPHKGNPWGPMRDLRATKKMAVFGTYDGYGSGALLNIGMDIPGGGKLTEEEIIAAVEAAGGVVEETAKHKSDSEDTLVIKVKTKIRKSTLNQIAVDLKQEAVVQRFDDETGTVQGPKAESWGEYNPDKFVVLDGRRATQVANPLLRKVGMQWPDQHGVMHEVTANDVFRAVHDAFGHGLEGAGFRAKGEENAWQAHRMLYTGPAIGAMTNETRGQNSWLNYGPYGEHNRTASLKDTIFADQKIGLMPSWTWEEGVVEGADTRLGQEEGADGNAFFNEEALAKERHNTDGSRELLVYMSPTDFLTLAEEGRDEHKEKRVQDVLDKGGKFDTLPYLHVDEDGSRLVVTGHEGRHRARALAALGVTRIPVVIKSRGTRWGRQNKPQYKYDYNEQWPDTVVGETGKTIPFTLGRDAYDLLPEQRVLGDTRLKQQQPAKRKRGSFDVRSFNIALMDPNKTTTLHELGHMFFEMMVHLAAEPGAPKQIVDDVNAMLKFLDFPGSAADYLKVPVAQRRKSHETMAEHFEAYLRSGKAPTVELQGLFRTFAKWLIEAYGALTRMIGVGKLGNVDMDPELRAIFDRMLATDEAIEQSAKVRALMPQFETAEQAGMTEEEFAEHQSRNSDVLDGAAEDLRAKLIRDMRWLNRLRDKTLRELTADAKAKRKAIRDEVTAEVDRMRVYRVMHFLKRGIMLDENGAEVQAPWLIESSKLNKAAVEALFPNGEVDVAKLGFGKYGMVSANGVDPGVIAGLFGYQSADEMVRDIVGAEPRGQLIDGMTEQRMLERYAEIATPEDLQKAADEAIASEAHTRMVATELAALDARQGKVSVLRKAAKYAAMGILGRRTVRNLRPDLSASAATRSRKDAAKALAAGKRDEAAAAKRNELLHVELERQGREAKREIEAFLRATKKVWKGGADKVAKSRDVELVMAARMVLGRYGIGSPAGMAAAANYVAMLAKYDGPHQQQVLQMTQGLPAPKEYKDLTLDEIRHVADIALGLYQMALDEKTMTIDGQKVAIDAVADRIVEGVKAKHGGQMPSDRATRRTPTPWDEKVDALRSLKANLSRVEFWAGNMGAVFKEAILQPVLEAITKYRARRSRMIKAYKGLLDEIAPTLTFKPITCKPGELTGEDGKPFTFSAGLSEVIHAILHTGNESNKRKLMLGRGWATENADGTLSHPGWDAFIARLVAEGTLTKEHFDFCQKVWDLLDSMKQDAQAAHKAVYGFYFHEITANELQTPFGTYRGGYVPAITDPRDVSESESKKDAEELLQSGNSFAFPTAPTGFTKQRVEYNRALHLDLRVLASHIDKVCRFTDVQPAVRDVAKLLMNKRVANALNRHDKKVINNMLIPWLQVSANQVTTRPGKDRTFDKFVSTIDSRTGMAIMFASVINTLQQATGFSAALVRTDENGNYLATSPEMLRQIAAYMSGPKDYVALAVSRSAWLDERMHNQTMEMRGAIDDMLVNANVIQKAEAFFARNAYFLQVAFQNMIDPIVFNAAYETAIARGATEKQARRAGEELIRTTLGTFAPEDVSAVEINTPIVRSMLKFYGFFNMWGNLLGSEASKALRQAGYMEPSKRLAFLWFAGLAMPAYAASLMAGNLPDDEDDEDGDGMLDEYLADFFGAQGRSLAAMVPGVGPITNFVVNLHNDKPYDDRLNVSPLMSTVESAVKSSDSLLRGEYFDEEVTKREVRDMSTLIAIATGIPTGPLAKMYGYEKDLESGRIEERGALGDVWGYATGK